MASFNKVIIMGNLTADIELRYTPQGAAVCEMRMAINEKRGKDKEKAIFLDVTVWDKQAETCSGYLKKGSQVLVEGRLDCDEWNDKETGKLRNKLKVVASSVTFVGGRDPAGGGDAPRTKTYERQAPTNDAFPDENNPMSTVDGADEIPF